MIGGILSISSLPSRSQKRCFNLMDRRLQKPIHNERHVKIICVGAGASGLIFAYKLQRSFENFDLTIYEKNEGISGTWFENKYPGCACDVPAHNYTYTFEPKSDWSAVYAGSDEVQTYFDAFCKKYELHKYFKLQHQVRHASWNDKTGRWELQITDLISNRVLKDECDFLINASGVLNEFIWPAILGLEGYKGQLIHTAKWDHNVNLNGKHVGLIGNGSSAVQLLPAICSQAGKITNFIRGPTWISPMYGMDQRFFSKEERQKLTNDPKLHLEFRRASEVQLNSGNTLFNPESRLQKVTAARMASIMKQKLHNDDLASKLIPSWPVGCRRITPGTGYLESLSSDKVNVVFGEITRITERGCVCGDVEYPIDILICATGFDTSYRPRFPVIGIEGKVLAEEWAEEPKGYLGIAAANFPNYFIFAGPNSPAGNGPFLCAIESQADYMLKFVNRWQTENIHSLVPKTEAVEDFNAHKDQFMKDKVWMKGCRSWYKTKSAGKISALWPGSSLHYLEAIAEPRYDDWNITYSGNRFAFLGNGFSQTEVDPTADWGYYIRNHDDGPYLGRRKQLRTLNRSGTVQKPVKPQSVLMRELTNSKSKL